jgi:hypothetical protein
MKLYEHINGAWEKHNTCMGVTFLCTFKIQTSIRTRISFRWVITQTVVVIPYRRFGATYRSFSRVKNPIILGLPIKVTQFSFIFVRAELHACNQAKKLCILQHIILSLTILFQDSPCNIWSEHSSILKTCNDYKYTAFEKSWISHKMAKLTNIFNLCSTESKADCTLGYIQTNAVSHHTYKLWYCDIFFSLSTNYCWQTSISTEQPKRWTQNDHKHLSNT